MRCHKPGHTLVHGGCGGARQNAREAEPLYHSPLFHPHSSKSQERECTCVPGVEPALARGPGTFGLLRHMFPFSRSARQLDNEDTNLATMAHSMIHVKAEPLMPHVLAIRDTYLKTRTFFPPTLYNPTCLIHQNQGLYKSS